MSKKYAVEYTLNVPIGGVKLTGGRFGKAFADNVTFLKEFDLNRMLYWYRRHAGKPAPGVPYAADAGHFENNLKGQTAGEFLMGACTSLLWQDDECLRNMTAELLSEMEACRDADGFIIPISRDEFGTREYPNYTRAWITFGLLDAGYAGFTRAFDLARDMSDYFNGSSVLPYVKDLNLGFQGILANTRQYDAPNGTYRDVEVAIEYYQESWWLNQVIDGDHRAIYDHPGNHPHSTLLTTLEGYLDLYRVTGEPIYLKAVKSALMMYEEKWQHVGGGISMCEFDTYWPGCNWLSPKRHYNELCSTNFWVLLNQRMHRLEPDCTHYVDEMEKSLYNILLAAQVGSQGYHYMNFLEGTKDWRYLDRASCCASLGTRLVGLLPQFLYTYTDKAVYCDIYAPSTALLPLAIGEVRLHCETGLPDDGDVRIVVEQAPGAFTLYMRVPYWAVEDEKSYYICHENAREGDAFTLKLPMRFRVTRYTGGEEIPHRQRFALEYGPLLYAAMGAPLPLELKWNPGEPENWFEHLPGEKRKLRIKGDNAHEYWAYLDIHDEPFTVYPIVRPERVDADMVSQETIG